MEIKLNQFTLPLLCSLVSTFTYAIICYTLERSKHHSGEPKKQKKRPVIHEEEYTDDDEDAEPEFFARKSKLRKDSLYLAKTKRKTSGDEIQHSKKASDYNVEADIYPEEHSDNDLDDNESEDPAHLLQERIKRSKKNKPGTGGRRGTIAFADELQATLADHFKATCDPCPEKQNCNGSQQAPEEKKQHHAKTIESSLEVKPILKHASCQDICEDIEGKGKCN